MDSIVSEERENLQVRGSSSADLQSIYRTRFDATAERRREVWRTLVEEFFQKYIPDNAVVVDIGAGYCDFSNHVKANRKIAMDLNPDLKSRAAADVEAIMTDVCQTWPVESESVDVCFSSNFIEHLPSKEALSHCLAECHRVLKPGGKAVFLGPNIRFCYDVYWDFFDHMLPLSDRSLCEALTISGFDISESVAQFLPYTMQGRTPAHPFLVKTYLKLPFAWRFFGKQFLVTGTKR